MFSVNNNSFEVTFVDLEIKVVYKLAWFLIYRKIPCVTLNESRALVEELSLLSAFGYGFNFYI